MNCQRRFTEQEKKLVYEMANTNKSNAKIAQAVSATRPQTTRLSVYNIRQYHGWTKSGRSNKVKKSQRKKEIRAILRASGTTRIVFLKDEHKLMEFEATAIQAKTISDALVKWKLSPGK